MLGSKLVITMTELTKILKPFLTYIFNITCLELCNKLHRPIHVNPFHDFNGINKHRSDVIQGSFSHNRAKNELRTFFERHYDNYFTTPKTGITALHSYEITMLK